MTEYRYIGFYGNVIHVEVLAEPGLPPIVYESGYSQRYMKPVDWEKQQRDDIEALKK